MENENSEYYQNYSKYEFSSRKGRSKKKRKSNAKTSTFNSTGDAKRESETVESEEDSIMDDNGSDVHNTKEENKEAVTLRTNVSLDGVVYAPPAYEKGDKVEVVKNAIYKTRESFVVNLNIEEEPVFNEKTDNKKKQYPVNVRALPKEAATYELENFEKHALIIFNQENIVGFDPRLGTGKDVDSLTRTFKNFGFEVTPHTDLTKDELFKELKTFSERDYTNYGCVAVAVLTHGKSCVYNDRKNNNGLLRAKDQEYEEIEIINHFKNKPFLATKPKLIIIQACRGDKFPQGVPVLQSSKIHKDFEEENLKPYIHVTESDFLILHSSYVGNPSLRDELYGSWFIQALCNKINTLSTTHDFESIFTEVKKKVAIDEQFQEYNKRALEIGVNKQMPVMTSTLIRKLYLRKFGEQPKEDTYVDMSRRPSESRREDIGSNSTPTTPGLFQFGPCYCFLEHFTYMRNCLRYYVEENSFDDTAQHFLDVANTFDDDVEFNTSKDKMCKAISKYLWNKARCSYYYKYLHFKH